MKEKLGWIFCLLLVLVITSQTFMQKGQADEKERWEYMSLGIYNSQYSFEKDNQPSLNKLGEEGWELAGVNSNTSHGSYLILKRKKK